MEVIDNLFKEICNKMKEVNGLNNENKLKIYGLFKVATEGKYNIEKDKELGFFDFEKKYKYESWKRMSKYSSEEAKIEYIKLYFKLTNTDLPGELNEFLNKKVEDENIDEFFNDEEMDEINKQSLFSDNVISVSSTAQNDREQIKQYLESASNDECAFYDIQQDFRNKTKEINEDYFKAFSHLNRKYCYYINYIIIIINL